MKKIIQYSFAALAGLVLASCNGSYDDWSSPQRYDQEDPAEAYGVTTSPSAVTMPVSDDDVTLFSFSATSEKVVGYNIRELAVNQLPISYTVKGNDVIVSANELEDLTVAAYASRASVARALDVEVEYGALLDNGDAVAGKTSLESSLTPRPTPSIDEKGYYLLGSFEENGSGWDLTAPVWMTDNGDGTFSAIVNTTSDGDNWYKFYEGSHYSDSDWDEVNAGQMGCKDNGNSDSFGLIVWTGDKYGVQTPVIQGKGQFKVTIDMVNMTYKVTRQAVNYYIIGGPNDWGASAASKELKFNQANIEVPVYTIVFPAAEEGDTWFAIGDDKACDAIVNDGNWKLLYGTTNGNGNSGESGTLARREALADDGSFKVDAGAKFIKVTINMDNMTYECTPLNFGEYIYEAGTNNEWGAIEQPLYCPDGMGTYTGFFYSEGADWAEGKGAFKFQGAFNTWDEGNYGYASGDETSGTLIDSGDSGNILVTPGFYRADINLANMTYTLTPINSIFVVGSAVNDDWDVGVEMTYNVEERCWECTTTLNDGQIKFKGNGTWDSIDGNWGGTLDNIINGSDTNIDIPMTGEVTIKFWPRCDSKSYATITAAE
jgi:hypothetical protein